VATKSGRQRSQYQRTGTLHLHGCDTKHLRCVLLSKHLVFSGCWKQTLCLLWSAKCNVTVCTGAICSAMGRRQLGRPERRWKYNTNRCLNDTPCSGLIWLWKIQWCAFAKTLMNLCIPPNATVYWPSSENTSCCRGTIFLQLVGLLVTNHDLRFIQCHCPPHSMWLQNSAGTNS